MQTVNRSEIREHMPIVCSNNNQFATVDHLDGDYIKVTKDDQGKHHWIPLNWVATVDSSVHVDRPGDQAKNEWLEKDPNQSTR